jgi:hypothetical protein
VGAGDDRLVSDEEQASESRAMERLTFFSDAVVAIAITLLALDLPVPEGDTFSVFWSSVHRNAGHYAAFLISFFVIAGRGIVITMSSGTPGVPTRGCGRSTWPGC